MKSHFKAVSLIAIGVCFGLFVWFALLRPATGAPQPKSQRPILSKLPPIKNCVEHIKIINAELKMQGDSQVVSIEVENEAYVGVVSISLEQVVDKGKHSAVDSGFTPDKAPLIVIEPGARKTLTLGNLESKPIRIGGAMFSDGSEEGCESALKDMRELKDFHTKKVSSQK